MKTLPLSLAALGLLSLSGLAVAQDHSGHMSGHEGHTMSEASDADAAPSTKAFEDANAAMHEAMAIDFTGSPDVDFVRSMIPHHEGAVAMAKVQLQYGKDPELRKLAEEVVAAQEPEIAAMKAWVAKNAK
ncbi:DUF305 domain-containing protein [Tianweitania sp.]|uniref:CopM family metallochaperone n=1 Tax=Tianweitania sp. TaxID=2021634 RepID=UPI0028987DDA|nr:DUF305 domain-containing protein [Tianweitania sp.]